MINADQSLPQLFSDNNLIEKLQNYLYEIDQEPEAPVQQPIAEEEPKSRLIKEISSLEPLGTTRDQKQIYLCHYFETPSILNEIGRQREITFRAVGEGTGKPRDLDEFDKYYRHLVLWDKDHSRIVGAYRVGIAADIMASPLNTGLYTQTLFNFLPSISQILPQTIELGRSYVHPDYQGKNSLDYLWQGIGQLMNSRPELRYFLGPVTVSAEIPEPLTDELVFYFGQYNRSIEPLATARNPREIEKSRLHGFLESYKGLDEQQGILQLQSSFSEQGLKIPVLFKQYSSLFEKGGLQVLDFSIDPDFSNCIDGLFLGDIKALKASKRKRYLGG